MLTRRHIFKGAAGWSCMAALPLSGCTDNQDGAQVWEGEALGAPARLILYGLEANEAPRVFAIAQQRIERLEKRFSLYRPDSEISRLNREGRLAHASEDFRVLLAKARHISVITHGAFDITVQVLWQAAKKMQNNALGPQEKEVLWRQAANLVDYNKVRIEGDSVRLMEPGMAITLNGIAQGYITEQVAISLAGFANKISGLVNVGEFQAFGERWFNIAIEDPRNVLEVMGEVKLKDAGLATSSALGGYLGERLWHIFRPQGPSQTPAFLSASVVHPSATFADALATSFTLLDESTIRKIARQEGVSQVVLKKPDGQLIRF